MVILFTVIQNQDTALDGVKEPAPVRFHLIVCHLKVVQAPPVLYNVPGVS